MIISPELEEVVKKLAKTKRLQNNYANHPLDFVNIRCREQVELLFWQYWLIKTHCISKTDRQKKLSEFDSNKVSDLENINFYGSLHDYETELKEFYIIKSNIETLLSILDDVSNYHQPEFN